MGTLKLTLAYDGTDFAGWQVQEDKRTVQNVLEMAWAEITREKVRATASGRTDAGVHALAQVVSLRTTTRLTPEVLRRALNAQLPGDLVPMTEAGELGVREGSDGHGKGLHFTLTHPRRRDDRFFEVGVVQGERDADPFAGLHAHTTPHLLEASTAGPPMPQPATPRAP